MKVFIILGAINALLAVGLGAFGAHGLEGKYLISIFRFGTQACSIICITPLGYSLSRFWLINYPA